MTTGRIIEATQHFGGALALCRSAGIKSELAWTCRDYAELLLNRPGAKGWGKVIGLFGEAKQITLQLGMSPLLQQVDTLRETAMSRDESAIQYPYGLSEREVEVISLIAPGIRKHDIIGTHGKPR